jgi:hypothetical protein
MKSRGDGMQSIYTIDGADFAKYNPELDWSGKIFEQYNEIAPLRRCPGIYAFTLCGEIVYIGSSTNLFGRLQTHIANMQGKTNYRNQSMKWKKYHYLNKHISNVQFKVIEVCDKTITKDQLENIEYKYINQHCPIFNINYKDSLHRWSGSEEDIDNFVNGTISMDELTTKSNTTK